MITPFKANMEIDWERLASMINYVIEGGTDYIVALGTTAETPTLSKEEKRDVIRFFKQQIAGRVPLVIGAGGNNTLALTKELQEMELDGVEAILSVTPYYNKPSQEGIYRHFMAVAEASPVPVIIYNVPGRTGVNMTAETTLRLAHATPKIVAIKEASGDIEQMQRIIDGRPEGFLVISGDDGITVELMKRGGEGVISVAANAFPKAFCKCIHNAMAGDFDAAAKQMEEQFTEPLKLIFREGNPTSVKVMTEAMGLTSNEVRLPLAEGSQELARDIKIAIERYVLE